jgi:hypothetical protein
MECLLLDLQRIILINVMSVDAMTVCKWWRDVITNMPQTIIRQYIHVLIKGGLDRLVAHIPPRVIYRKMLFDQQILFPNILLVYYNHRRCTHDLYLQGYKERIAWPVIFERICLIKSECKHPIHDARQHFAGLMWRHEQYRHYMLTTYPVAEQHDRHLFLIVSGQEAREMSCLTCNLWSYYMEHNVDAITYITKEWSVWEG